MCDPLHPLSDAQPNGVVHVHSFGSLSGDTATPHPDVPTYLMFDRPSCSNPASPCVAKRREIQALLRQIRQGLLTIRSASDFAGNES